MIQQSAITRQDQLSYIIPTFVWSFLSRRRQLTCLVINTIIIVEWPRDNFSSSLQER
jgi:hypothetical protein